MAAGNQPAEPNVLRSIWAHRVLVVLIVAAFALIGIAVYLTRPVTYAAEAGALLEDPMAEVTGQGAGSKGDAVRYVADQVAILKSDDVLARASLQMRKAKGVTPLTTRQLQNGMTVQTDQGSSYVVVHVEADDPTTAKIAANSIIQAYRITTEQNVAATTREKLRKIDATIAAVVHLMSEPHRTAAQQATALALIQQLRAKRNRIEIDGRLAGDGISLFAPADPGKRQGSPLFATVLIAVVLGGLVGCGSAYLIDAVGMRKTARQGPVGPTPVTSVREVPDATEAEGQAATPIKAEPGAEPVARRRSRRWG